jgi:hypothetical protein
MDVQPLCISSTGTGKVTETLRSQRSQPLGFLQLLLCKLIHQHAAVILMML